MKKLIFTIVLVIGFSMYLSNGLSIVNAQQENIKSEYLNTTTTNLTKIFGEPIYKETSRQQSTSIVLDVKENIKTQLFLNLVQYMLQFHHLL